LAAFASGFATGSLALVAAGLVALASAFGEAGFDFAAVAFAASGFGLALARFGAGIRSPTACTALEPASTTASAPADTASPIFSSTPFGFFLVAIGCSVERVRRIFSWPTGPTAGRASVVSLRRYRRSDVHQQGALVPRLGGMPLVSHSPPLASASARARGHPRPALTPTYCPPRAVPATRPGVGPRTDSTATTPPASGAHGHRPPRRPSSTPSARSAG
jgi:hypothetical protein